MNPISPRISISKTHIYCVAPVILALLASLAMPLIGVAAAAASSLVLMAIALALLAANYGVFSPLSIIVSLSALYALAPSIGFLTKLHVQIIEPGVYFGRALPMSLVYLATVLLMYGFHRRPTASAMAQGTRIPSQSRMILLALLSLCGSLSYLYSVSHDVGLTVARFNRGEQQLALTSLTSMLQLLAAAGSLYGLAMWSIARQRGVKYSWQIAILLLLALCVFAFSSVYVLGDRRIFLSTIVALLAISNLSGRWVKIVLLLAIPAYIAFSLYAGLRGVPLDQWSDRYEALDVIGMVDPSRGEFGGWTRIAQDVLSQPFVEVAAPTVFTAPLSVVPSFLYPERPLASSLWYVQTYDPITAMSGGAWAFSLVVESFMNFWIFGPIVFGFFVSLAIARCEIDAMPRLIMVFVLAFSFRADVVSLIQQTGWMLFFVGMFYVISRGVRFR